MSVAEALAFHFDAHVNRSQPPHSMNSAAHACLKGGCSERIQGITSTSYQCFASVSISISVDYIIDMKKT